MNCFIKIIILCCLFITGCASTGNRQIAKFTEEQACQCIKINVTTKVDIKETLGDPMIVDFDSKGHEKWFYKFTRSASKVENFIPIVNSFTQGTNDTHKTLVIIFNLDNTVLNFSLSESKGETKVGIFG